MRHRPTPRASSTVGCERARAAAVRLAACSRRSRPEPRELPWRRRRGRPACTTAASRRASRRRTT
eukprot:1425773-Prymnesium_polylepis.2